MAKIKISSKVEQSEWEALQAIAYESKQSIAGLLSEAVADFVRKRRLRPEVGHTYIVGSLENGRCDYDHILPWIQQHLEKMESV